MIYIYSPNLLLLLVWVYYFQYSILFSVFLTPISYLVANGYLIYNQKFNEVHAVIDQLVVFQYTETMINYMVNFIVYLFFMLPYVNKLYGILKVKVLLYFFNKIVDFMPSEKTNPLTEELQNDYLEILKRNRRPVIQ